jgi:CSLREA domain-containing protein
LTIDGIKGGQNGGISITAGGKVTLNNSTISNNWSNVSGIGILNSGTLIMNNSTISGNHGTDNNGNHIDGAGIYNGGTATIRNSTIAFNNSFICGICGHGGGIYNNPITGGTVTLANTIVVENDDSFPSDLYGTFISEGYNMYFDVFEATITGDTTTDVRPVFPRLAPLANNGGGVKTHALLFDSPAIDHGKSFGVSVDQRGLPRGVDQPTVANGTGSDISDIGAFELQLNTVLVNTTADGDDGACTAVGTGNGCTLREAINAANSTPLGSTISLDPTAFPKTAARADSTSAVTLQLTSALPALSSFTTISGPGARELSVRGEGLADPYSIFTIASGATVTISGLTITNGVSTSNVNGGGITNAGTLTLQNAAVSGNPASITVANASGGIVNSGTMTIVSSTISGNLAGSVGFGGGIYNNSPGVLTLQNSTVSGNTARGGGGIHNISTMTLQNSTVSSNTATIRGGGIDGMATVTLKGSIVAGNTALSLIPDIDGTVQSDGYNLIGNSGGTTINQNPGAGPNITDVDPQLGPLANNGGQTDTHAPSPTSPAIDQGKAFGSTTDQRGLTRPIDFTWIANAVGGDGADIGAFERQFATAATVTISGRILTADGRGVRNARITLTDSQGISRSVLTYSYGYYVVSDIRPGESVVINITSRRYRFTPQLLTISDSISGLDFVLDEP